MVGSSHIFVPEIWYRVGRAALSEKFSGYLREVFRRFDLIQIKLKSLMGGSIITPVNIEYYSDRGGDYTITLREDKWTFRWGSGQKGVEIDVFQQDSHIAGYLVRNNLSKKTKKHFDAERDGYLDVLIANETVEIKNVLLRPRGICTKSVHKVIFATMRIYARQMKHPIRSGIVKISSEHAKAAYNCYKKALKMNGFSTVTPEPLTKRIYDYVVVFTRDVYQEPKLTF